MTDSISLISVLSSAFAVQTATVEAGMATLRKTNDVAKQEGEALVQMLEDATSQMSERLLDIYA